MRNLYKNVAIAAAMALGLAASAHAGLVNSGFEAIPVGTVSAYAGGINWDLVPMSDPAIGWKTTATDGLIEIWKQPGALAPFNGQSIPAYQGNQYAELNATQPSSLYQDASFVVGNSVSWTFAHRGRIGVDTAAVTITDLGADGQFGTSDDVVLRNLVFSDGTAAWGVHTSAQAGNGGDIIITNTDKLRFAFTAISSASSRLSEGNLIDAADFGVGVLNTVPEPSSLALAGLALVGAGAVSRRRTRG